MSTDALLLVVYALCAAAILAGLFVAGRRGT